MGSAQASCIQVGAGCRCRYGATEDDERGEPTIKSAVVDQDKTEDIVLPNGHVPKLVAKQAIPTVQEPFAVSKAMATPTFESIADSIPPGIDFTITLDNAQGGLLGLVLLHEEGKALAVEALAEGLIEDWNTSNPSAEVQVGDVVVSVNGIRDSVTDQVQECRRPKVLRIVLRRIPGGPRARDHAAACPAP